MTAERSKRSQGQMEVSPELVDLEDLEETHTNLERANYLRPSGDGTHNLIVRRGCAWVLVLVLMDQL